MHGVRHAIHGCLLAWTLTFFAEDCGVGGWGVSPAAAAAWLRIRMGAAALRVGGPPTPVCIG